VTVNPTPSPITGNTSVCLGLTTALSDATAGGTWSSSTTTVATIDPVTGVVYSVGVGTTTIVYTSATGGCYVTTIITVNPLPAPITGITTVCAGSCTQLSDAPTGGAWFSGNP